jgi:hypothetical protein
MRSISKEKVEALVALFDVQALLMRSVLHDELLQEHERPLVPHVLPHLHATAW